MDAEMVADRPNAAVQFNDGLPDYAAQLADGYDEHDGEPHDQQGHQDQPAARLRSFLGKNNIVPLLDADVVSKIGMEVVRGYDLDKASRCDWEKQMKTAMDLAMQIAQEKSWPWPKAANVKYPLITTAAIQFSARAYPAIVRGAEVVKGQVIGPDPEGKKKERAERIGHHMSYQVLEEIDNWDEEEDKLLLHMSIVGCAFRKTYFDNMLGRPCSDLVMARDLVYDHATPWHKLRRKTHCLPLFKNDVIERVRGEVFEDVQLGMPSGATNDEDGAHDFLEQHCWYDLDEDGYKEPYVVTVLKESGQVARIVARFDEDGIFLNRKGEVSKVEPVEYFTKFAFMPNPDGGSYDVGLGLLLNPINETVNTVLNQLLDAGTLANTGGGFIGTGLKMKGGAARFVPGEYKPVDNGGGKIADNIYHMQFPGPNTVLFQLLGMLIEAGKDISSVKDILTGDQQVNQTATTTLALIEQGQKVFSAIYKRVHRSLKLEFKKLFRLNRLYLEPEDYYRFQDKVEPIYLEDYQGDDTDVAPVSDPNLVSDAQELARAEALMKFINDPLINQIELRRSYLQALKVPDIDRLLAKEAPKQPEDPALLKIKADIEAQKVEVTARAEKMMAEMDQLAAKVAETEASTILKLAQAEAIELGPQMDVYMAQFQAMLDRHTNAVQASQQPPQGAANGNDEGAIPGMGGDPADQAVPAVPEGLPGVFDGSMGQGPDAGQPGAGDGEMSAPGATGQPG
jgi:chaperonin GroES